MKKIALIIGHNNSSQGAVGSSGISEYKFYLTMLRDLYIPNNVKIFTRLSNIGYSAQMRELHKNIDNWGADISISLHFNASINSKVDGHEVLFCSNKGKKLASIVDNIFDKLLENRDRNTIKRTLEDRGGKFLCKGKSICLLVEPFFASNQHKYIHGGVYRDNLIKAISEIIDNLS